MSSKHKVTAEKTRAKAKPAPAKAPAKNGAVAHVKSAQADKPVTREELFKDDEAESPAA